MKDEAVHKLSVKYQDELLRMAQILGTDAFKKSSEVFISLQEIAIGDPGIKKAARDGVQDVLDVISKATKNFMYSYIDFIEKSINETNREIIKAREKEVDEDT